MSTVTLSKRVSGSSKSFDGSWLLFGLVLSGASVACSAKDRPFVTERSAAPLDPTMREGGGQMNGPVGVAMPAAGSLGASCFTAAECDSGFCVDGVCCDSPCSGACQQCSGAGVCDLMPADDPACGEIVCPESTECVAYPDVITDGRCLALGQCKTPDNCVATQVEIGQLCTSANAETVAETRCDALGSCVDARGAIGGECIVNGECSSGSCRANVCCESSCDGVCERCGVDGLCEGIELAEAFPCGDSGELCHGRGRCLLPPGATCTEDAECGVGSCQPAVGGGQTRACCSDPCPTGQLCASDGRCVAATADLGQACSSPMDCALGHCVDGVCCDSACAGVCETCNALEQAGRCAPDLGGGVCDAADPRRTCVARGQCLLPGGATCTAGAQCSRGFCEPALDAGVLVCCARACDDETEACNALGECQAVPRINGAQCESDPQCASGNCDSARCCPADCVGACAVCTNRGTCEIPSAAGSAQSCAPLNCESRDTECQTFSNPGGNLCEGVGDCKEVADCVPQNAPAGRTCAPPGAAPGTPGRCNGSGVCEVIPTSELCANIPSPTSVTALSPLRGAYTGSLNAPAARQTLRPTLAWTASATNCGPLRYQVQIENGCTPGALDGCQFSSPEVDASVTEPRFQPSADLAVSRQPPVGAVYTWRVRACDAADRCSPWSPVAYINVGRVAQDINGDGYADVIAPVSTSADVYLGGPGFDARADQRVVLPSALGGAGARFVGDLNGDGFGDVALLDNDVALCGSSGQFPVALFGGSDVTTLRTQVLCSAVGSASVLFKFGQVGDLNGDGFDEFAFTRELGQVSNAFRVLLGGTAVGSTAEIDLDISIPLLDGGTMSYPHSFIIVPFDGGADFNGDGFSDVVLSGSRDGTDGGMLRQRLLLGGATMNREFASVRDITGCFGKGVVTLGDVNEDGRGDWGVLCGTPAGSRFGVISGGNQLPAALVDGFETSATLLAISRGFDFDSDGSAEVFLTRSGAASFVWRRSRFNPAAPTVANQLLAGDLLGVADHNGDGRLDLLVWTSAAGPSWGAAGASLNFEPINLLPSSGTERAASIVF